MKKSNIQIFGLFLLLKKISIFPHLSLMKKIYLIKSYRLLVSTEPAAVNSVHKTSLKQFPCGVHVWLLTSLSSFPKNNYRKEQQALPQWKQNIIPFISHTQHMKERKTRSLAASSFFSRPSLKGHLKSRLTLTCITLALK